MNPKFILDEFNAKYYILRKGKQCIAILPRHFGMTTARAETLYNHWLLLHDYFNTVKLNIIFMPLLPIQVKQLLGEKIHELRR